MNKEIMSICFSVCNYNAASPLSKFMPRKGFFFFVSGMHYIWKRINDHL